MEGSCIHCMGLHIVKHNQWHVLFKFTFYEKRKAVLK